MMGHPEYMNEYTRLWRRHERRRKAKVIAKAVALYAVGAAIGYWLAVSWM